MEYYSSGQLHKITHGEGRFHEDLELGQQDQNLNEGNKFNLFCIIEFLW